MFVSSEEARVFGFVQDTTSPFDPRTSSNFDLIRNNDFADSATGLFFGAQSDSISSGDNNQRPGCGEVTVYRASTQFVSAAGQYGHAQTHMEFDSSGITGTVSDLTFECRGMARVAYPTGETAPHNDISIIFLKSEYNSAGADSQQWNTFSGHGTNWSGSDFFVKEYSAEIVVTDVHSNHTSSSGVQGAGNNIISSAASLLNIGSNPFPQSFSFNSDAKSDLQSLSTFKICMMDYDALYQNSYDNHSGFSQRPGSATTNENLERAFYFGESDLSLIHI